MANSVSRLTMYALLSAIEEDLRDLIVHQLDGQIPTEDILGGALYEKASQRLKADPDYGSDETDLHALLLYTDFADVAQILSRHRALLGKDLDRYVKEIAPQLQVLAPIRNRVMHSRPLNYDDLAVVTELSETFATTKRSLWTSLCAALREIQNDPSSVLKFEIPIHKEDTAYHNLPTPDFDETGFIGRTASVNQVINATLGAFPVITIVGEGGIGKTALAVKVAYEILDRDDNPFEAIVFTSAKTAQLNVQEIRRIEDAISSSVGMLEDLAGIIAARDDDPFNGVITQLKNLRILLILDNLETVLDDRIRGFLSSLPQGSKVLITSRIGIGAFEYPVRLTSLEDDEAVQLLRAVARARGVAGLVSINNKRLAAFCKRMRNNPLHIKWFVSAVQAGKRPEEILANDNLFLEFCLSNVYDFLSQDSRLVLRSLLCVGGKYTLAELAFLTNMDDLMLQRAVQQLLTTNMLSMSSTPTANSYETRYELASLARAYLAKVYPASKEEHQHYTRVKQKLIAAGEEISAGYRTNPTSAYNVQIRSRSDWVVAKYLHDALTATRRKEYGVAEDLITRARNLAPDYFEVFRVYAWLHAAQGNLSEAMTSYEAAVDLEPDSVALRMLFGGFLLRDMQDNESALAQFEQAARLDAASLEVKMELARTYLFMRDFDKGLEIIQPLLRDQDLPERSKRIANDLQLQFHQRMADHFVNQQAPIRALQSLKELRANFGAIPSPDAIMRLKLSRASHTANACLRALQDTDNEDEALEMLQWLSREGSNPKQRSELRVGQKLTGTIHSLPLHQRHGFIRVDAGPSLFFHRNSLLDQTQWPKLFIGQRVTLLVTEHEGDIRAGDVAVDAASQQSEAPTPGERFSGVILRLPKAQSYGFLRSEAGPEFFFHKSSVEPPSDWFRLEVGLRVLFQVGEGTQGRARAVDIQIG